MTSKVDYKTWNISDAKRKTFREKVLILFNIFKALI